MKAAKNNQPEVLEPEVEELPLEKVIDTALIKHNVTDAVIASLKEKYSGMKLKSLDDKESYLEIKKSRQEVRRVGILTEKICKHGRQSAIEIQKMWLNKEKDILGKIAEVEDPLNAEIKRFDDELERKETEEKNKREELYINRQAQLSKMGAVYNNGSFELNHISYEVSLIKESDNQMWEEIILPKYKKVYEEIEAVKVQEENKRKEELEKQKKEREEFELKQAEFKKQQEAFAQKEAELQKQKDEADRKERLAQEQKDSEERIKKGQIIDTRINQLRGLGMSFNHIYTAYTFEDINIDMATEVNLLNDEEWSALIEKITPVIAQRKEESAKRIFETAEKQKQADIQKALEDERIKRQQEEQKKAEELAVASDKSKWLHFTSQLSAIQIPEFKSNVYKKRLQIAKDKIEEIQEL